MHLPVPRLFSTASAWMVFVASDVLAHALLNAEIEYKSFLKLREPLFSSILPIKSSYRIFHEILVISWDIQRSSKIQIRENEHAPTGGGAG